MPKVTFIYNDGQDKKVVDVESGTSIMEAAHENHLPLEGACEGSLACSTCHVVVNQDWFNKLDEASDDELDMLDLAFGLKPTSRLGCQVSVTDSLDGITVEIPKNNRND